MRQKRPASGAFPEHAAKFHRKRRFFCYPRMGRLCPRRIAGGRLAFFERHPMHFRIPIRSGAAAIAPRPA